MVQRKSKRYLLVICIARCNGKLGPVAFSEAGLVHCFHKRSHCKAVNLVVSCRERLLLAPELSLGSGSCLASSCLRCLSPCHRYHQRSQSSRTYSIHNQQVRHHRCRAQHHLCPRRVEQGMRSNRNR
jgi:hypothetical protein